MSQSINKPVLDNLSNDIWKSAERLRGKFKAYEYQSVILPLIVIRRLECVLLEWRKKTTTQLTKQFPNKTMAQISTMVAGLEKNPQKSAFYNESKWTLASIYNEDTSMYEDHFRAYLNGFSTNVQDIIDHFNYKATVGQIVKNNRLGPLLNQYKDLEIGPDKLSNLEMGYVYEELLRRFSEQSGEEAGEHFTPREVIRLMVELLEIPIPEKSISIYDPACGTGGMLSVAKEHLLNKAGTDEDARKRVEKYVATYGQEIQPGNYAICCSDLLIKNDTNSEVHLGNSLIPHDKSSKEPGDQLAKPEHKFDYMLSNPPFGVTWGGKDGYEEEARKFCGVGNRYEAGMPRINDGALLFLQTMLSKTKKVEEGGSRIAVIFNGSPLSNGDCGSGESEIRRWILKNDWLDAIVMLPDQLFYNTGIFTYIWLLRTDKPKNRKEKVILIDARKQFEKEPKSFGNKRNRITETHQKYITKCYRDAFKPSFSDSNVKIFSTSAFAYHKVNVVFWQFDENDKPATITEPYEKAFTPTNLKKDLDFYNSEITFTVETTLESKKAANKKVAYSFKLQKGDNSKKEMAVAFEKACSDNKITMATDMSITAQTIIWTHPHYISDAEYIPYEHGKNKDDYIKEFLDREIAKPIIRWSDSEQLGCEILPNKYFYVYEAPKQADELLKDFWKLEKEAEDLLKNIGGYS